MTDELQLRTGAYRTTFIGTEIIRKSTLDEWRTYGEILRRVDEAKQWAIGDWLKDGKRHYRDGLYKEASQILGLKEQTLRVCKSMAEAFPLLTRVNNLSFKHHRQVASLKQIEKRDNKLHESKEPDKEKMQEFLKKAESENLSVRELKNVVEEHKRNQQDKIRLANEPEKFSVIYADPPWQFDNSGLSGSAEKHYNTMSLDEICDLPIESRVTENAVLFLWVPNSFLKEGLKVCESWGFDYKTNMTWIKDKSTYGKLGFYCYGQHELLFIATRGSFMPKTLFPSIVSSGKSKHSKKPEKFYELIEKMYSGPYLELFARNKRGNWEAWGNEVI
ncbi:MAG TPA: MT-A70 family methyltransferase [Acidobacteriota bacterium]|nr:MT-A70 family methyltransferase [Acidobacteriota bacterium]